MVFPAVRVCRQPWRVLAMAVAMVLMGSAYWAGRWCLSDPLHYSGRSVDRSSALAADYRRAVATQLQTLGRRVQAGAAVDEVLLRLDDVIRQLDPQYAAADDDDAQTRADTCPEVYGGSQYGYPHYETGFHVSPTCEASRYPTLSSLLTVLLVDEDGDYARIDAILHGLRRYQDGGGGGGQQDGGSLLPVCLVTVLENADAVASHVRRVYPHVHVHLTSRRDLMNSPGRTLNALLTDDGVVNTPYVLVARDIFQFDARLFRLERSIYVISTSTSIQLVGGSYRNESGYWRIACYQTQLRNYLLRYTDGYRYSTAQDCMLCDFVDGPFVVNRSVFSKIDFHVDLKMDVMFHDFFLRLKQEGILAVACPDVLYLRRGPVETIDDRRRHLREEWLDLAREWQVDRVYVPGHLRLRFQCDELSISCDATRWYRALLLPRCCLDQIDRSLSMIDGFARDRRLDYEIDSGTLLGAVKFGTFLPWDRDADVTFREHDYAVYKGVGSHVFAERGLSLSNFQGEAGHAYFRVNTPDVVIEMWGSGQLSTYRLPPDMWDAPTRVRMMGAWLRAVSNPGLYARNRYGPYYLRHAQHWRTLGLASSWENYTAGRWLECPKKAHHACLDHYPTDGNVAFAYEQLP